MFMSCGVCKGVYNTTHSKIRIFLRNDEENENIKIRYSFTYGKSKTIEIKFITAWFANSYIPIPVYIYDKTLT